LAQTGICISTGTFCLVLPGTQVLARLLDCIFHNVKFDFLLGTHEKLKQAVPDFHPPKDAEYVACFVSKGNLYHNSIHIYT